MPSPEEDVVVDIVEEDIEQKLDKAREVSPLQFFGTFEDHQNSLVDGDFKPHVQAVDSRETIVFSGSDFQEMPPESASTTASVDPRDPRTHENAGEPVAAEEDEDDEINKQKGDLKVPFTSG